MSSVPPTQPPAAPETDVSTPRPWPADSWPTAAELADWLSRCTSDERLSYADHSLATAQRAARCVDQQHAALLADLSAARERVRVVEGERDAARREERMRADDHAKAWRVVAEVDAQLAHTVARAESAEAAHAALVAGVEALAARHYDEGTGEWSGRPHVCGGCGLDWPCADRRAIDALKAGGAS